MKASWWERGLVALGGAAGLGGVALSAAAAHLSSGPGLETAARFLLVHAPVFLALSALSAAGVVHPVVARIAGLVLASGLVLFCGDLALRAMRGVALLPLAAPTGGIGLMLGWVLVAGAAMLPRRSPA